MPKHVKARAAQDQQEERKVRKLAGSHHALADWRIPRADGAARAGSAERRSPLNWIAIRTQSASM